MKAVRAGRKLNFTTWQRFEVGREVVRGPGGASVSRLGHSNHLAYYTCDKRPAERGRAESSPTRADPTQPRGLTRSKHGLSLRDNITAALCIRTARRGSTVEMLLAAQLWSAARATAKRHCRTGTAQQRIMQEARSARVHTLNALSF